MKFRPQIQLRFRHAEQFELVRERAKKTGDSVNEWILKQIEQETDGLVRKSAAQATSSDPDEGKSEAPSAHLGGNGPNVGQARAVRGAGKTAPNKNSNEMVKMSNSDALRAMREGRR